MSSHNNSRGPLVAEKRDIGRKPVTRSKKPRAKRKAAPKKRGILGWIFAPFVWLLRIFWRFTWRIGVVVVVLTALGVFYTASQLPDYTELVDGRVRGSVTMSDRDGEVFAKRGDQFGGMITAQSVSPHLRNAVVAVEDKRFFRHIGVSPRGVASAVRINLRNGRGPLSGNGGSTITQQTAKLLCLGVPFDPTKWDDEAAYESDCRTTTLWRKVKEAVYALGMEVKYTKDEILTVYLNRAYTGGGYRGFEASANGYFGKPAAAVNPAEAAMLAGLLPAPSVLAPTNNLERSQNRAGVVIGLMEDQGLLSKAQADDARANPAVLSEAAQSSGGGYFADWVMSTTPSFFGSETTEDVLMRTTLDPRIQTAAEEALLWVFENKVRAGSEAQAAVVVMSPDGAVRAMVGGRNVKATGGFNRATQAVRQTGSAFKPFIYATALELGFSPYDLIDDQPLVITVPGSGEWALQNYDREFKGPISLTQAIAESRNIPAVVLSEEVGRELIRQVAQGFGIQSDLAAGPAMALGVSESTLIEMTGAYAGILNGGSSVMPYGLVDLRMRGDTEPLMTNDGLGIGERVIREPAARQLTWMMTQVVEQGTGRRAQLDGWQIAAKTGTTQGARDAWFIGFTGDYVTGVWMGYDDNRPLTGVTGSGLPADIWRETMARVTVGQQPTILPIEFPQSQSSGRIISHEGIVVDDTISDILEGILSQVDE
jgi:membrane peptidoglycan carboxypeptidase